MRTEFDLTSALRRLIPARVVMTSDGAVYLEVARDLVGDGAEELLAVRLRVGAADGAALRGVAVAQDGDDERLVRAPPCTAPARETNARSDRAIASPSQASHGQGKCGRAARQDTGPR